MAENGELHPHEGLRDLTAAVFEKYMEQEFEIETEGQTQTVVLAQCTEYPDNAGPDSPRTPFTLLFRAEVDESHPIQQAHNFLCTISGLAEGPISVVSAERIMRPARLPSGAYFHVVFS